MLKTAIALARTGDKEEARKLLRQIVTKDPYNEHAWGWLAYCAETIGERRQALERVLEINPENEVAYRTLEKLGVEEPAKEKLLSPEQTTSPATIEEPSPQPEREGYARHLWDWSTTTRRRAIVVFGLLIIFAGCCPCAVIAALFQSTEPEPTHTAAVARVLIVLTPSATPTATIAPSRTPEPTDTSEPSATPDPTASARPTDTSTSSSTPVDEKTKARVLEVIDGDTIRVLIDGVQHTVRYIGIDAPETKDPSNSTESFERESAAANEELVGGETVLLEKDVSDTDNYGRLLRYVYVGDLFVNEQLVRLGFAQTHAYPPDVKFDDLFATAQLEAMDAQRGLWLPQATSTLVPLECLDSTYVADVTVADNTRFEPGEAFVKTWRVRNTGACPWPDDTKLVLVGGDALGISDSIGVGTLGAGETTEISAEMASSATYGRFRGTWRLSDGSGRLFGGNLTVVIRVVGLVAPTVAAAEPSPTPLPTLPPLPTPMPTWTPIPEPPTNCDPAYPTVCIPPPPPDLDCKDIPFRRFQVLPPDPHYFDGNSDGVGCES